MKKLIALLAILPLALGSWAIEPVSYKFAERDTCALMMDIYAGQGQTKNTTVLYVFGGGFINGSIKDGHNVEFFRQMANRGYTVAAIDYRLGLKGVKNVTPLNPKPAFTAVRMATEDLISATDFLIKNQAELKVDTSRIVIMGSSAGAITVLQADFELANRSAITTALPSSFRYAGVVAMAGSVFSTTGKPSYPTKPSPTLFLHGTADKVVVYKKIQVFNLGMFGTDALVRIFEKQRFPYMTIRYVDAKHEVAEFPRHYNQDLICDFIDMAVAGQYTNQVDVTVRDRQALEKYKLNLTRKDLYNGN